MLLIDIISVKGGKVEVGRGFPSQETKECFLERSQCLGTVPKDEIGVR